MMGKKDDLDIDDIIRNVISGLKDELDSVKSEIKADLEAELEGVKADIKAEIESIKSTGSPFEEPHFPTPPPPFDDFPDHFHEIFGTENNTESEDFSLTDFSRIHVSGNFDVEITCSESYNVSVTADKSLFRNLDVSREEEVLHIRHSRHIGWRARLTRTRVTVSLPVLKELSLSGATNAEISGFNSPEAFRLRMSGACKLRGDITAGKADFEMSGASRVTLSGSAGDAVIKASGANRVELRDFAIGNAAVKLSGASRLSAKITGRLDARLSGASHFSWLGEPVMGDIRTSGAASLSKE